MSDVILVLVVFVGLPVITLTILVKAFKETAVPPRNQRRKDVLPAPSPNCQRTPRLAEPN